MITVSAIVPAYNRADTLARALASVHAQTRAPDEVIVVDDGSTDGTAALLGQFPQVKVVRLEANGGAGRARNEGVRRATGELIAFLDSDDEWARDKLERQLARIDGVDLLCTGITVRERSGRTAVHTGAAGPRARGGWTFADFQAYPFSPTTWLVRRDVLLEAGLFDESLRNCEDLDLLARMAHRRIGCLTEALATKHNRDDSLDATLERTAESYAILFVRHRALWARSPAAAARACRRLANMHIDAGRMAPARRALVDALRYRPLDLKAWGLLALSPLGNRAYGTARRLFAR